MNKVKAFCDGPGRNGHGCAVMLKHVQAIYVTKKRRRQYCSRSCYADGEEARKGTLAASQTLQSGFKPRRIAR